MNESPRRDPQRDLVGQSEDELADLFEQAPIGLHCVGPDGVILRANRAELALLGYAPEEYVGHHIAEFHADPDALEDIMKRLFVGEELRDRPARLRGKDGSIRYVLLSWNVLRRGGRLIHARCFIKDVTERAEAEAANRAKDEFLTILSHELRTPLNAILGWAKILRSGVTNPAMMARALETIERNAQLQVRIIDDLLDVSRIVSGKLSIKRAPVDPAAVVEQAVSSVRSITESRGVVLETAIDPHVGLVSGDAARLHQIVGNLLSNAVKFTDEGGRIDVSVGSANNDVEIRVSDTGQGINPGLLPHVFERFRQADSITTRAQSGLGLGLAIVRHLIELHGGTVMATSEGEGRGATFTVRLPRLEGAAIEREARPAGRLGVRAERAGLHGVAVLVVDDHEDNREVVVTVLRRHGARVIAVASAREALDVLAREHLHVVVSDVAMPGIDGYDLIAAIRSREAQTREHIAAIALTARARREDRAQSLRAGFDAHVGKPVDPHRLVRIVALAAVRRGRAA